MNVKELVGKQAATYIKSGMIVGLGTGSTAYYFVEEIGRMVKEEGLDIVGVPTSIQTKKQAENLGIPLKTVDEVTHIDITVDGADEVNHALQGIKGGGGALLFEKIVAEQSEQVIWIVDDSKVVDKLGKFPLPVEVVKYGAIHLFRYFEKRGYQPVLRQKNNETFVTDDNNYIIDLHLNVIENPIQLAKELDGLTGVVEHGLFLTKTKLVLIGTTEQTVECMICNEQK